MSIEIAEPGMVIFDADGFRFGTEVNQIISIVTFAEKLEEIDESIPFVDLTAQLRKAGMTSSHALSAENVIQDDKGHFASDHARVALIVDTIKGVKGVYVESVRGVVNMPLEQIVPLPEFLKTRMQTNCIWGIGKLETELVILLDLASYLVRSA